MKKTQWSLRGLSALIGAWLLIAMTLSACSPLSQEEKNEAIALSISNLLCAVLSRHGATSPTMDARSFDAHALMGYWIFDGSFLQVSDFGGDAKTSDFDEFMVYLDDTLRDDLKKVEAKFGSSMAIRFKMGKQLFDGIKKQSQEKYGYSYESCGAAHVLGKKYLEEHGMRSGA